MSTLHRESLGTALGPYSGADFGEWHRAELLDEAERARLAHEASPDPDVPELPSHRRSKTPRPHRLPHLRLPAVHSH